MSVAAAGFLPISCNALGESSAILRGAQASVAAIVWGAMLLMHFRSAHDARRLVVLARVGAFFAIAQVPLWLLAIWVEFASDWAWRAAERSEGLQGPWRPGARR